MISKRVYLLWPRAAMPAAVRGRILLQDCAPALLQLGLDGLQINVHDAHVNTPSPAPKPLFSTPFVAQVNVWSEQADVHAAACNILHQAGFELAAYRVDEWLYTDYGEHPQAGRKRDWPDGQRSPGVLAVTLLRRPKSIPRERWMQRWFGWQSPMSEWMQPRARYVRNVVVEALSPDAQWVDGIVEEDWPSSEHVTNARLFYGASSRWQLLCHMFIMLRSVTRMLRLWNITTVMMSEYFLKTPPAQATKTSAAH